MRQRNLGVDSSVPLTHRDPKDLGLICLVKKRKIHFRILSDLRIQSWIFLKKRTLKILEKEIYTSRSKVTSGSPGAHNEVKLFNLAVNDH